MEALRVDSNEKQDEQQPQEEQQLQEVHFDAHAQDEPPAQGDPQAVQGQYDLKTTIRIFGVPPRPARATRPAAEAAEAPGLGDQDGQRSPVAQLRGGRSARPHPGHTSHHLALRRGLGLQTRSRSPGRDGLIAFSRRCQHVVLDHLPARPSLSDVSEVVPAARPLRRRCAPLQLHRRASPLRSAFCA